VAVDAQNDPITESGALDPLTELQARAVVRFD
jgi:hypothetical protein